MHIVCKMFLRATKRYKDGKEHRYWSVVENRRVKRGRVVQKTLLYLGEINDSQQASWHRAIDVVEGNERKQTSLFPSDRKLPSNVDESIQIQMSKLTLARPRQWGGCWLAVELWRQLRLERFWEERLPPSRKGTKWSDVLLTLVAYRLLDPGSEWRLHCVWFDHSAMADLLDADFSLAQKNTLYRCLDKVLKHREAFFSHLRTRWQDLFGASFEVLLYDLTSTYFESDPPHSGELRRYGYSRDKRSDCVQVVIALVVTPEGFPLAYEVMPGNTSDKTTLRDFLEKIEKQYGKADRVWVMDRGIPTEEVLEEMRAASQPVQYIVGTPKGRLSKLEKKFLEQPWHKVRDSVEVKLLPGEKELYVLARSGKRIAKERAIRQRKLRKLLARLKELQGQQLTRDQLLLKIGAAKKDAGRHYSLVSIHLPESDEEVTPRTFSFSLNREKLRVVRRREGRYLLRSNIRDKDPAELWQQYIQLTEVEAAFKDLKDDLSIRPIFHQSDERIEAHIFVAFMAYCLFVTLKHRARCLAPGFTARAILEQMSNIQMLDVYAPTTDGRQLKMSRYTKPDKTQALVLTQMALTLPPQPPPEISPHPSSKPSL